MAFCHFRFWFADSLSDWGGPRTRPENRTKISNLIFFQIPGARFADLQIFVGWELERAAAKCGSDGTNKSRASTNLPVNLGEFFGNRAQSRVNAGWHRVTVHSRTYKGTSSSSCLDLTWQCNLTSACARPLSYPSPFPSPLLVRHTRKLCAQSWRWASKSNTMISSHWHADRLGINDDPRGASEGDRDLAALSSQAS